MEFKVVVAGSRGFRDYGLLCRKLDHFLSKKIEEGYEIVIISGHASGADTLGENYARERGYRCEVKPADWNTHGKSAGYIRNKEMARICDAVVLFWDGKSPGTNHMRNLAIEFERPHKLVCY